MAECSVKQDVDGTTNSTSEGWVLHTGNMRWSQLAPELTATTHAADAATNDAQIGNSGGQAFNPQVSWLARACGCILQCCNVVLDSDAATAASTLRSDQSQGARPLL